MQNLPRPWDDYLALQTKLSESSSIDDTSWGREAALNRILASDPARQPNVDRQEIDRAARSERRRERHRARIRRVQLATTRAAHDPEHEMQIRQQVRATKARVTDPDWAVLCALGEGQDYGEIAAKVGVTSGALRIRVLRLRQSLPASAAVR